MAKRTKSTEIEKSTFSSDMQKALDEINDTPLKEPELYKIIDENQSPAIDLFVNILGEEKLDDYNADEIREFSDAVKDKVTSFKDEDGCYKTTEALDEWEPVKPSDARQIKEIQKNNKSKSEKLFKKLTFIDDKNVKTDKHFDKYIEHKEKLEADFEKIILETTDINAKDISKWEKALLLMIITSSVERFDNSKVGKLFKNLSNGTSTKSTKTKE